MIGRGHLRFTTDRETRVAEEYELWRRHDFLSGMLPACVVIEQPRTLLSGVVSGRFSDQVYTSRHQTPAEGWRTTDGETH